MLVHARADHTATLLSDGRVLLAGGYAYGSSGIVATDLTITNSAEIYNPSPGRSKTTGPLMTPRVDSTANLLNDGNVFAAGGSNQIPEVGLASIEEYNPSTGRWSTFPTMLAPPRYKHTRPLCSMAVSLSPEDMQAVSETLRRTANFSSRRNKDP